MSADLWPVTGRIVAALNQANGVDMFNDEPDSHETAMRLLKVAEEAGEVSSAYIGMTGQNPRKGTTHTPADVADELCDVIIAAAVALRSFTTDPAAVLDAKLHAAARRLGAAPEDPRCPAAHRDDPTPCTGSAVVTVLDAGNDGASGCEHHAARLLASLDGGRVYALPDAPDGAAVRVFTAAAGMRPFPWMTGPRHA
jgi:hypothetical protein